MSEATPVSAPVETGNLDAVATKAIEKVEPKQKQPVQTKETEAPKEPKKYKIFNHDGTEREIDEDTYKRWSQKLSASDKFLSEAKAQKRELEAKEAQIAEQQKQIAEMKKAAPSQRIKAMLEELQDDPNALNEFRGSVEEWLVERLKEESADPATQRALKAERDLEKYKKQEEIRKQQEQKQAWEKAVNETRPQTEKFIVDTLKLTGLPPTEWNVKSVADVMFNARQKGHKPTPEQVAAIVKEDRIDNIRAVGSQSAQQVLEAYKNKDFDAVVKHGAALEELYGPDILKALRAYDIRKHMSGQPIVPKEPLPQAETQNAAKQGSYEFKNMDEWIEHRRKLAQSMK